MGRQAFFAVWCMLVLAETLCASTSVQSVAKDNESAESAPRLYRNVPVGVYASANPYGSYSIPIPFISAPKASASRIVPIKEVYQNSYLKDSYGNRFVGSPSLAYKTAYPQQYVQLQELPAHLSQPIVAAAPSYQYRQPTPFGNSHYTLPLQQASSQGFGSSQPYVYGGNVKYFASNTPAATQTQGHPIAQQQSTSHKAVYANNNFNNEPKFQRLQQVPKDVELIRSENHQGDAKNAELQDANAKETAITTVVNGKKTVINVETKPVLPLLDLSLLEPLTFANPLVPQVQHFLPRINQATYVKLPQPEIKDNKNYQKEFIIQKTKSYDSGNLKGKPQKSPKKKEKRPSPKGDDVHIHHDVPRKQTVIIKGNPQGTPEIAYEINSPNYKETYKEKAVSYNKETNSEPVHYSYGSKSDKKPVSYSYSHSSKQPAQIKQVHYKSVNGGPKQLIYNFDSEEQRDLNGDEKENLQEAPQPAQHSSGETHDDNSENHSSEEQRELDEAPQQNTKQLQPEHREREQYHAPPNEQYNKEQHRDREEYHAPGNKQYNREQHREQGEYHAPPNNQYNKEHNREQQEYHAPPNKQYNKDQHREQEEYHAPPNKQYNKEQHREQEEYHAPPNKQYNQEQHREREEYHAPPNKQYNKEQHREREEYHAPPNEHYNKEQHNKQQQYNSEPHPAVQNTEQFHPVAHYAEDIQIIQPEKTGHIKVDPGQHVQQHPQQPQNHSPSEPQNYDDDHPALRDRPHNIVPQHIHEKSRKVIIQEETPEEMHSIHEQMKAEMIGHEENNEEDFEKAYKDSAIGFPAYERHSEDVEKDIYNPESYGVPRDHSNFDIEHTPFQQYQDEGDEFPKATRVNYKDARDKTKEDYYLDYSVSRPESLTDRYRNKVDYYKLYQNQKPERYTVYDDEKKQSKQSAKYTAAPYLFGSQDQKPKQTFAKYKTQPVYEYDYSKAAPRDNSAFASHPYRNYKSQTLFVEPQFQYGFEPVAIPRLLDSELSAMASIIRPESEKPGMRKKIYQENFYIKKTSTSAGEPSS